MLWLNRWAADFQIARTDKIWHEMEALCWAFKLAGSYDQLNLPCLRSIEVVARRTQSIADAHRVPGATPNWKMAKYYVESSSATDVVAPRAPHLRREEVQG